MAQKSYRINTTVNNGDNIVNVELKQGIGILNILSLEIKTEDTYQMHTSDYGVIVGRVLANDAFGVPNVKVSVFIPLADSDSENSIVSLEYPFKTTQSVDDNNIKYNLLPDKAFDGIDGKHVSIGTFPNKNLVLDNDGEVEVFDKYWKYTTVTNESGDYMLFGIPTGTCQVHYDCDLSDIGIISQKPYDLINKGYNADLFKSPTEFLDDDLNSAIHVLSQDKTVYVYPFWGDSDKNKIGITRNDINLDYKFEPSCIFMGSSITDSQGNYIGVHGMPNGGCGRFANLITSSGNIEVIRKTLNGKVESLSENVNGIIDGNGIWCYYIPMNLDRIGTDENGQLIRINDQNKGIPTRASVRFRVSLTNTMTSSSSDYTGKVLIPCNPKIKQGSTCPKLDSDSVSDDDWDNYYEFGTNTPDSCFRDLYWGKVYSVKQYYPRIQYGLNTKKSSYDSSVNYKSYPVANEKPFSCISSIEDTTGFNVFPYNTLYSGAENHNNTETSNWFKEHLSEVSTSESLVDKGLFFCLENDWINGCLYFPRVQITKIHDVFSYFGKVNDDNEDSKYDNVFVGGRHDLSYSNKSFKMKKDYVNRFDWTVSYDAMDLSYRTQYPMPFGLLTLKQTSLNEPVFYYRCGGKYGNDFYRLYATDIILLGNISNIYDSLPSLYDALPSTSAIFPPMSPSKELGESGMNMNGYKDQLNIISEDKTYDTTDIFGNSLTVKTLWSVTPKLNDDAWFYYKKTEEGQALLEESVHNFLTVQERYSLYFAARMYATDDFLMYLSPAFVNASRICELDVVNDHAFKPNKALSMRAVNGVIDRFDVVNNDNRSIFASMNFDINKYVIDSKTHRKKYIPTNLYMVDFDGILSNYTKIQEFTICDEEKDDSYVKFRYGTTKEVLKYPAVPQVYSEYDGNTSSDSMLLTENSLYFYFGLHAGNSAIDVFKNKYGDYTAPDTEDVITVTEVSTHCDSDNIVHTLSISVNPHIKTPIEYYIYKQDEIIYKDKNNLSVITYDVNEIGLYDFIIIDANQNEYSTSYFVENNDVDINYIVYSSNKKILINSIGSTSVKKITKVSDYVINVYYGSQSYYVVTFNNKIKIIDSGNKVVEFTDYGNVVGTIKYPGTECIRREFYFSLEEDTTELSIKLNNVPVTVLSKWDNGSDCKWESRKTAIVDKKYKFTNNISVSDQYYYLSQMMDAIFNNKVMNLVINKNDYLPIAIYPFLSSDSTTYLEQYNINGYTIPLDYPIQLGENHPTGTSVFSLISEFHDNRQYTDNSVKNSFAALNVFDKEKDIPKGFYPRFTSNQTGIWTEEKMLGIQSVDKRFDYNFMCVTPLILPSGYDLLPSGVTDTSLMCGSIEMDVYGGIRFDYDDYDNITCYQEIDGVISGSPTSSASLYSEYIYEDNNVDTSSRKSISSTIEKESTHICDYDYIDKISYKGTLSGKSGFHMALTDCSTDIDENKLVKPGNTLNLDISYENAGVPVDTTIYYCYSSEWGYYYPEIEATHNICFKVRGDNLYNGNTYSYVNTSGRTYEDIDTTYQEFVNGIYGQVFSSSTSSNSGKSTPDICLCNFESLSGNTKLDECRLRYYLKNKVVGTRTDIVYDTSVCNFPCASNSPCTDDDIESYYNFVIDDTKQYLISPAHRVAFFPVQKLYKEESSKQLKQGLVWNTGYAYYFARIAAKMIEDNGVKTVYVYLYSPFKDEGSDDDMSSAKTNGKMYDSSGHVHSVGKIVDYYCDDRSVDVSYDYMKLRFTLTNYTKTNLNFTIQNGFKYVVKLEL